MAEDDELHLACFDLRPVRAVLRYVALVVGCLSVGVAFCFDLFAVYGETLKLAFGFSQKTLALIISATNLGMISALPAGILVQKYDPRWLSGGAFILSTTSCLLIWGTTYHVAFYREYFYVLAIFYFFLGCSGGFMYMLALSVNLLNFNRSHSGIVSGVIHAMRSVVFGILLLLADYMNGRFDAGPPAAAAAAAAAAVSPPGVISGNATNTRGGATNSRGSLADIQFLQNLFQGMLLVYGGVNFLACIFYGRYSDLAEGDNNNCCDDGTENELMPIRTAAPIHYGTQTTEPYPTPTLAHDVDAQSRDGQSRDAADVDVDTPSRDVADVDVPSGDAAQLAAGGGDNCGSVRKKNLEVPSITSETADLVSEPPASAEHDELATWRQLLKTRLFHQLLWPSVFLFALRNTYVTNLSVIMASFGLDGDYRWVVYAVPIVGVTTTPIIGLLADLFGHRVPRSLYYFLLAFGLIMINLTNMGFAGVFPVIVLTLVWSQLSASCVQTLGPSLHLKFFSGATFPASWGILTLLQTVLTLLLHFLMALLYDAFTPDGVLICVGFRCYIVYFLFCALLAYVSVGCLFFVVRYEMENRLVSSFR